MKDLLRRLTKDGQVTFYERTRVINKQEATELVETAKKEGYQVRMVANSFGYIVGMIG